MSKDDKENGHFFRDHFRNIFSRQDITFDVAILDSIKTHTIFKYLNDDIVYEEVRKALQKIQHHKTL